jgi:hypothetical protein
LFNDDAQPLPEEPSAPAVEEVNAEATENQLKSKAKLKKNNKVLEYLIPFRSFLNGIFYFTKTIFMNTRAVITTSI